MTEMERKRMPQPAFSSISVNHKPRSPHDPKPHSSSNLVLSISGKSNNSDTLISSPQASLCSVFSFGFLVLPDTTFSTVLCVMPESVASLLTVIPFCSISSFSRPLIASEYVLAPAPPVLRLAE